MQQQYQMPQYHHSWFYRVKTCRTKHKTETDHLRTNPTNHGSHPAEGEGQVTTHTETETKDSDPEAWTEEGTMETKDSNLNTGAHGETKGTTTGETIDSEATAGEETHSEMATGEEEAHTGTCPVIEDSPDPTQEKATDQ